MSKVPHNVFCTKFSQNSSKRQQNIMPYGTGRHTTKINNLTHSEKYINHIKSNGNSALGIHEKNISLLCLGTSWKLKILVNRLPMGVFLVLMFQINKDYQISDWKQTKTALLYAAKSWMAFLEWKLNAIYFDVDWNVFFTKCILKHIKIA